MMKLFGSHPEAVINTSLIAERCNVTMNLDSNIKLLKFQVESVTDNDVYFRSMCEKGLGMSYYICNTAGKTDSFFQRDCRRPNCCSSATSKPRADTHESTKTSLPFSRRLFLH